MVLMLGVGLTFVMGNLINAGSNDAELRSELLTQRQAAESLMFAEDLGTQALFLALQPHSLRPVHWVLTVALIQ